MKNPIIRRIEKMGKPTMKPGIKNIIFRSLFVVLVIILFLAVKYYNCILLDFSSTPKILLKNNSQKNVILLYGSGLCGSCPPGKKLLSLKNRVDILFVVPDDFNEIDLANFKDVFMIKAKVIRGNGEIVDLLKKIASCKRLTEWQNNIFLEIDKGGNISKIKAF